MMVENIPAMVCATGVEEFVRDRTAAMLDVLNSLRARTEPIREMIVPV